MDLASAWPLEVKFIITLRRSTPVIEYRRFELGPPGESKLPLSNRKYTDFLKILNNKNFYKDSISFWIFIEDFAEVYPVGINTTRTVHLFTRSGTDNRRVQKVADIGHTQKCHTTPEGPRSLHAATP